MNTEQLVMINETLGQYNAHLSAEGFIVLEDKNLPVQIVVKGKRLRFEGNGSLLMSGAVSPKTIESFVEQFWYWTK